MANVRNGNTIYVDSAATLTTDKNLHVVNVLVTATAASAVVVLADPDGTSLKADLRVATNGTTESFMFVTPVFFPNGIKVTTLTNAIATIIYTRSGGES